MLGLPKSYRQRWEARIPSLAVLGGGVGTGLKVRTRALYQLPVPLSPGFQTPGPPSACQARLDHQRPLPPFSNPNQVSSLFVPPALQPPRLGLGERVAKENTKRQQAAAGSQLPPGAHTPSTRRGGGKEGRRGGGTQHLPGEGGMGWEMGGSPKFRGGGEQPAKPRILWEQISSGPAKTDRPVPGKFTR